MFGMLVSFINLSLHGILCQIFALILSFNSNRQVCVVLDGKSSQEYVVNAEFIKVPLLFIS